MNLMQSILDVILGAGVLDVSDVDKDLLFMAVLLFFYFVFLSFQGIARFFMNLSNRF